MNHKNKIKQLDIEELEINVKKAWWSSQNLLKEENSDFCLFENNKKS